MPAAVESFASLRIPAWHGLGTVFDKPVSTVEMLDLASLSGWNLRLADASERVGIPFAKPTFFTLRDNPVTKAEEALGTVGGRYNLFSNEEIFDFGDSLTGGRRRWETAGSLESGTKVFASLVALDDLVLDPNGSADTIKKYTLLVSSHDGSSTMKAKKCNMRVVCKNTLNVALGEMGAEFSIRHTQGMSVKLEDAKRALGFADLYDERFEAEAKALFAKDVSDAKFWDIVTDLFPEPDDDTKGRQKKWSTRTDRLVGVWNGSTKTMENLPKNGWRAFQALTEDNQWNRNIRAGNTENFFAAGAGFDAVTNQFRTDALEIVKMAVGV